MDAQELDAFCTCSAFASHSDDHTPTCLLYTPISAMDIPVGSRRSINSNGSGTGSVATFGRSNNGSTRPPSYTGYGAYVHNYPAPSNVSSVAASYASTSSIFDSAAATETESMYSYPHKRSVSVCSVSSTASTFHILPTELFRAVFAYLGIEDLKSVVLVSRQWRSAANPLLWRTMLFPLDKRRLAAMKLVLSHYGHHVRRVLIAPPMLESQYTPHQAGMSSRRMSTSSQHGWSLSRPMSRSGSVSSGVPQPTPQFLHSLGHGSAPTDEGSLANTPMLPPIVGTPEPPVYGSVTPAPSSAAASTSTSRNGAGGFANSVSSSSRSATQQQQPTPLSSFRQQQQQPPYRPDIFDLAGAAASSGRRMSRGSSVTSPSPSLLPAYAVPIPGTPGPGNALSEALPPPIAWSSSNGGGGSTGPLGSSSAANGLSRSGSASHAFGSFIHHSTSVMHHEVSDGTVTRMHQFMERYCPNILEAVVRNPTGIASHTRRANILCRLFQTYPRLEKLDLSDFIMWDSQPLHMAAGCLQYLASLDVTNRVELSDTDLLPIIENCPRLRELRIRATNASDTTIHAVIGHLSQTLQVLNVGGCPVSSPAMTELVTKCTHLRILQTWSCLRLDDTFLLALNPEILQSLQVLDMMDVQKFSIDAVGRTFRDQKWPYLKYLRIKAKCTREYFAGIPERAVLKLNSTTILD